MRLIGVYQQEGALGGGENNYLEGKQKEIFLARILQQVSKPSPVKSVVAQHSQKDTETEGYLKCSNLYKTVPEMKVLNAFIDKAELPEILKKYGWFFWMLCKM